jgi:N utilization substance protein B
MSARHKARTLAVNFLYEGDMRGQNPRSLLAARDPLEISEAAYVEMLLTGVENHLEAINPIISGYAEGWEIDRMPAVDRAIARLGIFEILWEEGLDSAIAINEAVQLAKELSTENSATYINGLLGRVEALREMLA